MNDDQNSTIEHLLQKVKQLLNRFDEQKGIINSYVGRERDWKKNKIIQSKEITELKNQIELLTSKASDD
mgnify:CR=1 FL=1